MGSSQSSSAPIYSDSSSFRSGVNQAPVIITPGIQFEGQNANPYVKAGIGPINLRGNFQRDISGIRSLDPRGDPAALPPPSNTNMAFWVDPRRM